jgi:biotin synthase-related radical SAM superfamily protein
LLLDKVKNSISETEESWKNYWKPLLELRTVMGMPHTSQLLVHTGKIDFA